MKPVALEAAIPPGAAILLDSSAILAYLSGAAPTSAAAARIVDGFVATGRNEAVISAITVTEVLVRPMRAGSTTAIRLVDDFLLQFPNLRVHPVTTEVAREGARIRATTAAATPDALILATAAVTSAALVVGNDASWPGIAKRAGLTVDVVVLGRSPKGGS